ncbi:hypothetical protein PFISCL1PPCAC_2040, partial [Pristionchus fissidentatus]
FQQFVMSQWNRPKTGSYDEFKKCRELHPDQLRTASARPALEVLKTVNQMIANAKSSLGKFDLENGLIYYWRGTNIGMEFMKKTKLSKNEQICKRILAAVEECLTTSEKLNSVLESLYVQSNITKVENGAAKIVRTLKIREKDFELVSPRAIVQNLKNAPESKYLLIDIRRSSEEQVRYDPESLITVLNLPKTNFPKSGLTINNFIKELPSQDKHKLNRIFEFNEIIVMGEDTDDDREALNGIMAALVSYNYSMKLQKQPSIMEGGFKAWKHFYPTMVSGSKKKQTYLVHDDLTELITNFRKNAISDSSMYPDITPRAPSRESPTGPSPVPIKNDPSPPPPSIVPYSGIPSIPPSASTSSTPTFLDPTANPLTGPRTLPDTPLPPPTTSLSSIVYPTNIFPTPSDSRVPARIPPQIPNIPGRDLKPQNQERAAAGGSTVSLVPSINRSDKPSGRPSLSPSDQGFLVNVYGIVRSTTSDNSSRGGGRPGFTGLHNNGNTCFMNATLQAIFHTNALRNLLTLQNFPDRCNVSNRMGTNGSMVAGISALFDLMWSGQFQALRITRFIGLFSERVNETLADGRQHDAHEFQTFLLDALHEDTNMGQRKGFEQNYKGGSVIAQEGIDFERKNRGFADSPIQAIFYLHTVSELKCTSCGQTSATFEESSCLSLELPSSSSTVLSNSLNHHFSEVVLSGDESWNCPNCKVARPAKRTTSLWKLPPALVIHLKRFSYQGGGYVKNQIDVNFPLENLDLRQYFHPSSPHRPITKPYQLYSVTNHTGTLSSGHYTSVTNVDGSWVKCDDECLSNYDPRNISTSGSYILFYKNYH